MGLSSSKHGYESQKKFSVKLQAQKVSEFNGNAVKWYSWKKKTRAVIGSAGMLHISDEEVYALNN